MTSTKAAAPEATSLTAHPEYAYSRRQGTGSSAHYHAVLDQALDAGRFRRERNDVLCKPKYDFWGLEPIDTSPVTCPRCKELADRYGVTLTDPTAK